MKNLFIITFLLVSGICMPHSVVADSYSFNIESFTNVYDSILNE